jgi:hypothetical protein
MEEGMQIQSGSVRRINASAFAQLEISPSKTPKSSQNTKKAHAVLPEVAKMSRQRGELCAQIARGRRRRNCKERNATSVQRGESERDSIVIPIKVTSVNLTAPPHN